ncbi:rhythmically expressed gene 2 protein-like [Thrips palmi]|uniref:Rhythmically expressed gene 2 protein-like n=1 Tax=Thrips palmi TaxID=161013 RepID=A0A6P9ACV0_THRPL|nr:rhythmically expressed gene 2 protein-like [Thrips palmi]
MTRILKLITFDVTETLMMFQPPVAVKYAESAKQFGINVDVADVLKNLKGQMKLLTKQHPNFGRDTIGWNVWWTQIVVNSFKLAQPSSDEKALHQLAKFLIDEYTTTRCWALADGAMDLLNYLKQKNIPLGVISNYDDRLEPTLKSLKIQSFFNFILTSYSAGVMKPDRKIFDLARAQIPGDILPESCLHIGNSLEFDYLGAKGAGWNSAYVGPSTDEVLKIVSSGEVFKNLEELKKQLKIV